MEREHFYLDAHVVMHYPSLTADWTALSEADEIVLVFSAAVLRELDHHKDNHSSSNVRDRVRKALAELEALLGDEQEGVLTPRVSVLVELRKPQKERFEEFDLDSDEPDHKTLLSALIRREQGEEVTIVSDDRLLRMTTKAHGLNVIFPPDSRYPDPQSSQEKRIAQLERQLDRQPKISLFPRNGENMAIVSIPAPRVNRTEEVEQLWMKELEQRPSPTIHETAGIGRIGNNVYSEESLKTLAKEWGRHLRLFKTWAEEVFDLREAISRLARVQLNIVNDGTAPATGVFVTLRFPPPLVAYTQWTLPEENKRPEQPELPYPMSGSYAYRSRPPEPPFTYRSSPEFAVKDDGHILEIEVPKVNHGRPYPLPEIFVWLKDHGREQTFEILVTIRAENIAEAKELSIPVRCLPATSHEDRPLLLQSLIDEYDEPGNAG